MAESNPTARRSQHGDNNEANNFRTNVQRERESSEQCLAPCGVLPLFFISSPVSSPLLLCFFFSVCTKGLLYRI
ncbi:hypothetical protein RHMOL_Rhmol07G0134200 [Rhododendron molle]|uniref:Uncharacterized protein n=1 Tax=Rhododendron molle TaxID=49168 RepID=A0ACC0N0D6_RHOML|nr:hypothetical protein RHMOL_Rhmol07G0134200 [Rhododendron molle]